MTEQLDLSKNEHPTFRPAVWCGLVLAVLLVRGGVHFLPGTLSDDPDGYRVLAQNLVEHHCLGAGDNATAYRPPLYPLLVAACFTLDADGHLTIGILHLLSGLVTVWLVWRLGVWWGLGRYAALAALIVAVDPLLLMLSTSVMTETVATLLTCVSLLCLTRAAQRPSAVRLVVAGGCVGLAILCRPTFLVWAAAVACVIPWLVCYSRRSGPVALSERIRVFALFVLSVGIVLVPWIVRNQLQFGKPVIGTTHGGYTLLLANNPSFYDYLGRGEWGTVWDATQFDQAWVDRMTAANLSDEVSRDQLAYSDGRRTIRERPRMFLYACLVGAGRLWSPLPHQLTPDETMARRMARYAVGFWYLAVLSLAALGLIIVLRSILNRETLPPAWVWGLLLAASFTAVHAVYWSNIRMRAPLMPVVALAAAAAIMRFRATASSRKVCGRNEL